GVRCRRCGYKGGRNEFVADICPKCGHHHEDDTPQERPYRSSEKIFACSICGAAVSRADYWCPHCKSCPVGVQCSACGYESGRDEFVDDRCPKCNVPITNTPQQDSTQPVAKRGLNRWWSAAGLLVGTIVLLGVIWLIR